MGTGARLVECFASPSKLPASMGDKYMVNNLEMFIRDFPDEVDDPARLQPMCRRLCEAGYLASVGVSRYGPAPLLGLYTAPRGYDPALAAYGVYDFIAMGFVAVREQFVRAVLPLYAKNMEQHESNGTAFLLDDHRIVTAKHCIVGMRSVTIDGWNPTYASLEAIWVHVNARVDLAVLQFADDPFPGIPGFQLAEASVLDDVLTMGYPPIPGFDTVQVAERAQVAGYLQSTTGVVAAAATSYLQGPALLLTARVKGGNSGGPVINGEGKVVGVVSSLPKDGEQLDTLGYAIAVPSSLLQELLVADGAGVEQRTMLKFTTVELGFRTTPGT